MFRNKYGEHDAQLVRIAMAHASRLVGNYGYTPDDADDILQDLLVAGLAALPRFNPARANRATFLYRAIRAKVVDLIRRAECDKRNWRCGVESLDDPWQDENGWEGTRHDAIGGEDIPPERQAWRMDIQEVVGALPPHLRDLCILHLALRPEEARRAAGLAKSSHRRAVRQIREILLSRGIGPEADEGWYRSERDDG